MGERKAIQLDQVRTDGWFEKLAQGSPGFESLSNIIGERFVAFAVIAGVRITAVSYDRRTPDASLVDFVVGDDEEHRLPLGEFRRRLASTLLSEDPEPARLPKNPSVEDLQTYIGFRHVLLAPVFGFALVELLVGAGSPPTLRVEHHRGEEEVSIPEFREIMRDQIRVELHKARPESPFSIDFEAMPKAEAAAEAGDWEGIIELLGAWPGPLALLLRTPEGQGLAREVKGTLARALGYLGTAYVNTGRNDWGEEVMRLGIQWRHDGPLAGDLFRRLAESHMTLARFGEAIGLLRRGLSLGAEPRKVLPDLARCFAERKRYVAAMSCVEQARAEGVADEVLEEVERECMAAFGGAWDHLRERLSVPPAVPEGV